MTSDQTGDRRSASLSCEGWWDQELFGRQPMRELRLRFEASRIIGSGRDVIGAFTMSGRIGPDGKVVMIKRYLGMHAVHYVGNYDGEGLMWGQWWIESLHNRWLIKIMRSQTDATVVCEMEATA